MRNIPRSTLLLVAMAILGGCSRLALEPNPKPDSGSIDLSVTADVPSICGDGVCQGGNTCTDTVAETCRTCPQDCGACEWQLATELAAQGLDGVWGSSPTDVFVVGTTGGDMMSGYYPGLFHFDGSAWSKMQAPYAAGGAPDKVWGSSPTDVWVTTNGHTILHYDGSIWTSASSPASIGSGGIFGTSASDVWIVGGEYWFSEKVADLHFDGSSWTSMPVPPHPQAGNGYALYGVWASSPSDAFAVGGMILHYDAELDRDDCQRCRSSPHGGVGQLLLGCVRRRRPLGCVRRRRPRTHY